MSASTVPTLAASRSSLADCAQLVPVNLRADEIREGDLFIDPDWPQMFGRSIQSVTWHDFRVHLGLDRSAGLSTDERSRYLVLVPVGRRCDCAGCVAGFECERLWEPAD